MPDKASGTKQTNESAHQRQAAKPAAQEQLALTQQCDLDLVQCASVAPGRLSPADVLTLQRTVGNQAVQHLIQRKLMVGQAGGTYEHEADRVAAQVMTMPAPTGKPSVQRAAEEEEEVQTKPLVQREAAPEEEEVQAKPLPSTALRTGIQRRGEGGFEAGSDIEQRLAASRGSGSPLPAETREFMEPRFGSDFSGVRVHTGSEAVQINREVSAQAFTIGQDIYLDAGKYNPGSAQGKQLLAHELTHVVQQGGVSITGGVLGPMQRIQRASTTGLAATAATEGFAQEAYDYWKANPTKTRAEFAQDMIVKLNAKLLYPVTTVITTSGDSGVFSRSAATFAIKVNAAGFSTRTGLSDKISDLTQAEVGEVVDTLYHEARHAEQILRIAQMQAGQGKTASQISTALSIPPAAATAAATQPLDSAKPENATLIAEAEAWGAFMGGKYETYKKEVSTLRDEITALQTALDGSTTANVIANVGPKLTTIETHIQTFFDPKKQEIDALPDKKPFDTEVSQRIGAIRQAFDNFKAEYEVQKADASKIAISKLKTLRRKLHDARYDAYRAYEHEADAWAVGGAAGTKFKGLTATTPATPTTAPTTQ